MNSVQKKHHIGATLITALTVLLAGCTNSEPETPSADGMINALVEGLQNRSLDQVNVSAEPAANPQAQLEEILQPLLDASGLEQPQVRLGEVVHAEPADGGEATPAATAQLHWTWPFGDEAHPTDWEYDTTANFVYLAPHSEAQSIGDWQLEWDPSLLVPDFTPGTELSIQRTKPNRADILDGDGEPLVTLRPVNRLGIDKAAVVGSEHYDEPQLEDSARQLVALVAASGYTYDADAFAARVAAAGPRAFVDLITLRDDDQTIDLNAAQQIPAVNVIPGNQPLAPTSTFARAILGRAGEATAELIEASDGALRPGDITGLTGLQLRWNGHLSGIAGVAVTASAADGTETVLFERAATDGSPLETTFDVELQERAEAVLANVESAAAIVAIRPSTGEILAAASGPGSQGHDTALLGRYAPGSTFKVVDALAFARHGITADSTVACTPDLVVDGYRFQNVPGYPDDALGDLPLRTAFAHSCNTAMIAQADTVSQGDLLAAAQDLGFEIYTPIGTPAFYGNVPADTDAAGHAATMIGQGEVLASPLTMARVAASIATGHRVDPFLVRGILADPADDVTLAESPDGANSAGEPGDVAEPDDVGDDESAAPGPIPASNLTAAEAAEVRDLMAAVVTEGSATMLQDVPGIVGAKTGTAQFGDGSQTHAWMIAITDDSGADGDLAVAVFVDEGERGAATAGPLMRAFLLGDD